MKMEVDKTYSARTDYYDVSDSLLKFFSDFKSLANRNRVTTKEQNITEKLSIQSVEAYAKTIVYTINFAKTKQVRATSILNQMKEYLKNEFHATSSQHKVSPQDKNYKRRKIIRT